MANDPAKTDAKAMTTCCVAGCLEELETDIYNVLSRVRAINAKLSGDDNEPDNKVEAARQSFDGSIPWLFRVVNDNAEIVMKIKRLLTKIESITMEGFNDGQEERGV